MLTESAGHHLKTSSSLLAFERGFYRVIRSGRCVPFRSSLPLTNKFTPRSCAFSIPHDHHLGKHHFETPQNYSIETSELNTYFAFFSYRAGSSHIHPSSSPSNRALFNSSVQDRWLLICGFISASRTSTGTVSVHACITCVLRLSPRLVESSLSKDTKGKGQTIHRCSSQPTSLITRLIPLFCRVSSQKIK